MLAIIKDSRGNTYVSPILAICFWKSGWGNKMIVFDKNLERVKCMEMSPHRGFLGWRRAAFIFESAPFESKSEDWQGEAWIINDAALLKKICGRRGLSIKECPRLKEYAVKRDFPDWIELKEEQDIQSYYDASAGLHDAYPIAVTEKDDFLEVKFDTTWECFITLRFVGVTEDSFTGKVGLILDSEIVKESDGFRMTVLEGFGGWIDDVSYENFSEKPTVKCKSMYWKIEV